MEYPKDIENFISSKVFVLRQTLESAWVERDLARNSLDSLKQVVNNLKTENDSLKLSVAEAENELNNLKTELETSESKFKKQFEFTQTNKSKISEYDELYIKNQEQAQFIESLKKENENLHKKLKEQSGFNISNLPSTKVPKQLEITPEIVEKLQQSDIDVQRYVKNLYEAALQLNRNIGSAAHLEAAIEAENCEEEVALNDKLITENEKYQQALLDARAEILDLKDELKEITDDFNVSFAFLAKI
jgi:chromosome segregation ATPase